MCVWELDAAMSCMRGDQQGSIGGVATPHFERHDFVGLRGLDDLCKHGPCLPLQTERQTPVSPKVLRAAATAAEEQDVIAPLANGGAMGGGNLKVAVADRGRSMSMPVKKVSIGSRKGRAAWTIHPPPLPVYTFMRYCTGSCPHGPQRRPT